MSSLCSDSRKQLQVHPGVNKNILGHKPHDWSLVLEETRISRMIEEKTGKQRGLKAYSGEPDKIYIINVFLFQT